MKTWPKNMKDESSGRERTEFPSGFNTALSQCADAIESISGEELTQHTISYFKLNKMEYDSYQASKYIEAIRAFLMQIIGKSDPR